MLGALRDPRDPQAAPAAQCGLRVPAATLMLLLSECCIGVGRAAANTGQEGRLGHLTAIAGCILFPLHAAWLIA